MSYQRHIWIPTFLLLCANFLFSQFADSVVKNIRIKYESIRSSIKYYDSVSVDVWDESTEGGELTGFYKKKDLKLIRVAYFGETGMKEIEYYFDNDQLFFVFEKYYRYNRPIYWDKEHMEESNDSVTFDPAKTIATENRYYFHKGKLIRWLDDDKKQVDPFPGKNSLVGRDIIADAQILRDKLKKK